MPSHKTRHRSDYTFRQAAWTLGMSADALARSIRQGIVRTERRRGALVITQAEIARHLLRDDEAATLTDADAGTAVGHRWLTDTLDALDRYRDVPTAVVTELVFRDCVSMWTHDENPPDGSTDAEVARQMCTGCHSPHACLELELRLGGDESLGIWGGLCEQDRRVLHQAWLAERENGRARAEDGPEVDERDRGWA